MRISIVVDGQEYYHTKKNMTWRIDWAKILEFYKCAYGEIYKAYYCSGGICPGADETKVRWFWNDIEGKGWIVPDKDNKWKPVASGRDEVRINIDATVGWYLRDCFKRSDIIALFAGDGDYYVPLYNYYEASKKVICIGNPKKISSNLSDIATIIDIETLKPFICEEGDTNHSIEK